MLSRPHLARRLPAPRPRGSRRHLLVAGILLAALLIRIEYVQHTTYKPINDAGSYLSLGSQVANSGDYTSKRGAGGTRGPTAYFPPAYPYLIAGLDILDGHTAGGPASVHSARIGQAVLGTVAVGLTGLVALEAFGPTVALVALALAAVYPVLVELDGTIVAENLLVMFELAAVWAALRSRRGRRPYLWIAATGVLTGLATLAHENAILLLAPLIAAVWTARPRLRPNALKAPALLLATTALTIAPWTIRNATELHTFIPVSDEAGITLVGTYNPASAAFEPVPYKWRLYFGIPGEHALIKQSPRLTEPQLGDRLQSQALHYIREHPAAPDRRRVPQHAAPVRARGFLRVEGLRDRDRAAHRRRTDRRVQLLGDVRACARGPVHAVRAPRTEVDLGRAAAARAQRRARERRDPTVSRAGRSVHRDAARRARSPP